MLQHKKDGWKALLWLSPMLISFAVWSFFPIFNNVRIAFFPEYNWLRNYWGSPSFGAFQFVLTDELFWRALGNTVILVIITVPITMIIALLISVGLNAIPKFKGVFQTIFFLPYVTNVIAFGLVFLIMFSHDNTGLVNRILESFGLDPVNWTGEIGVPFWAGMLVISVYSIWSRLAFMVLIFFTGMQGIDKQYYQAAQIDGASKARVFRRVTIPLLSPMLYFVGTMSLIWAFQSYLTIVGIFGDDMGNAGAHSFITLIGYVFLHFNLGRSGGTIFAYRIPIAAAAAVMTLIFILTITILVSKFTKKRIHY